MDTENFKQPPPEPPLRFLEKRDLPLLVAWANNTALSCIQYIGTSGTLKGVEDWFESVSKSNDRADLVFEKDGKVRAFGGLTDIDLKDKTANIYMFVYPSLMNLGVGLEMVKSLCSYGFKNFELTQIYLSGKAVDPVAGRICERYGFSKKGFLDNRDYFRTYYVLSKEIWEKF